MGRRRASNDPSVRMELSERQREVLSLIAKGQTNGEIAEHLGITLDGVKWHVREILGKLDVDSREEAVREWRRRSSTGSRLRGRIGSLPHGKPVVATAAGIATVLVGIVVMAVLGARGGDQPPVAEPVNDVELLQNGDSLGLFSQEEALHRASDLVGFGILTPSSLPDPSIRLSAVHAHIIGSPGSGISLKTATLEYEVTVPAAADPSVISVEQYATPVGALQSGAEWETEIMTMGAMAVTVQTRAGASPRVVLVARFPASDRGFHVSAPLDVQEEAIALTRALVEAYQATR